MSALATDDARPQRKATPFQVAKAVFWSFLGIRRRAAHEHDAVTITPLQAIVAGLIGAAIFVLSLVALVRFVTGQ
jgi:type IV secretory pathway TrbF-like protein